MVCMPRGVWAVVSMIGVWKTGAALTVVEDNYAEERIAFIKKDCGCKAVIDLDSWQEINAGEPKFIRDNRLGYAFLLRGPYHLGCGGLTMP